MDGEDGGWKMTKARSHNQSSIENYNIISVCDTTTVRAQSAARLRGSLHMMQRPTRGRGGLEKAFYDLGFFGVWFVGCV